MTTHEVNYVLAIQARIEIEQLKLLVAQHEKTIANLLECFNEEGAPKRQKASQ